MSEGISNQIGHNYLGIIESAVWAVRKMMSPRESERLTDKQVIDIYQPIIAALINANPSPLKVSIDRLYEILERMDAYLEKIAPSESESGNEE